MILLVLDEPLLCQAVADVYQVSFACPMNTATEYSLGNDNFLI
jgi:hypothetical protein